VIGPALVLLGSYLAVSPGGDLFMLPKLLAIFTGAFLCLLRPSGPATLRPYFLLWLAGMAVSAHSAQSWLGLYRSPTAGILGAVAVWLSYEAGAVSLCGELNWLFITVGAAICSVLALLQLLPAAPFHGLIPNGRSIGTIGSPPYLGCMLALALPVGGAWALPVIVLALLATRSKAAIIGAMVGVAVKRRMWDSRIHIWAFAFGAVVAIATLNRGASDTMRIYIWQMAWKAFLAHPMLGVGADNFGDAFITLRGPAWIEAGGRGLSGAENAHNLLLNILATGGVLGLVTRGILAWKAWPTVRSSMTLTACYASVLAYSLFNPTPFMAWSVLAFMLGSAS